MGKTIFIIFNMYNIYSLQYFKSKKCIDLELKEI